LDPGHGDNYAPPQVAWTAELGMCFAGSAINSLFIKEPLVEILRRFQPKNGPPQGVAELRDVSGRSNPEFLGVLHDF
jgi:hypothetical protein